jgi:hypothetical protein
VQGLHSRRRPPDPVLYCIQTQFYLRHFERTHLAQSGLAALAVCRAPPPLNSTVHTSLGALACTCGASLTTLSGRRVRYRLSLLHSLNELDFQVHRTALLPRHERLPTSPPPQVSTMSWHFVSTMSWHRPPLLARDTGGRDRAIATPVSKDARSKPRKIQR